MAACSDQRTTLLKSSSLSLTLNNKLEVSQLVRSLVDGGGDEDDGETKRKQVAWNLVRWELGRQERRREEGGIPFAAVSCL